MDHLEHFDRRGRLMDDLLMQAARLPPSTFTEPDEGGGPSLRDLFLVWLEEQRRAVHGSMLGRAYTPLPLAAHGGVFDIGRAFGGFRMTLREQLESLSRAELARRVEFAPASGAARSMTVSELLAHLAEHDAKVQGLIAERLRLLGAA